LAGAKQMRGWVFTSAPHKLASRGSAT